MQSFSHYREKLYRTIAKGLVYTLYRTKFTGFEKIPETGPAILISNHVSYMDGVLINAACKRPIRFVIDRYIYESFGVNHVMRLYNAIPIEAKRESVEAALVQVEEALKNGELVFIFPEGQLTFTGNLSRFRFGVEWMIKRVPVPVYPLAIRGMWGSVLSRKYRKARFKMIPRSFRRRVALQCGDPVPPEKAKISHLQQVVMRLKNSTRLDF